MGRNYDFARIIGYLILAVFFIGMGSPFLLTVIIALIIIIALCGFIISHSDNINPNFNIQNQNRGTVYSSRQTALENVRLYLAPHTSIWNNLRVSNKFCTLRLGADGKTITGSEKTGTQNYRKFRIVESKIHTMQELWDMFCLNYDFLTSYNGLIELCNLFRATYQEEFVGNSSVSANKNTKAIPESKNTSDVEKLDINNATEVEITALPGISIVLSKKIIKKREEIGGFKTVEDLFIFLKLKPHMESQLRNLICVKKMKGSVKIQRTNERSIDL